MKSITFILSILLTISFLLPEVDARRRRKKRGRAKRALRATKQTKVGIKKLMGRYHWDMTAEKVLKLLKDDVRKREAPIVKATKDPLLQDQKRREMLAEIKKVKKNYVTFEGKRTAWDVSLIDKEFAHKNNESMAVTWGKKERRFFFFHHGRLYKQFIAFNADLFSGKSFEDFAKAMESRFGRAERKYTTTIKGDAKMDHLAWPQSGDTMLLAYDYTGFYGNFCLILLNTRIFTSVKEGRKLNSPPRQYSDPLVSAVIEGSGGSERGGNEDVVDQVTGKRVTSPKTGSSYGGSGPSKKGRKNVNPNNPLDGLDI